MYLITLGLSLLCFLAVAFHFLRGPTFSVFHPLTFYLAFHGLLFVIRPMTVYFMNYEELYRVYEFMPSLSDKITVILATNLGFLIFSFFCLKNGNLPMSFNGTTATEEERRHLTRIFVWVVVICGPLALYSLLKSYGTNTMMLDRNTGITINTDTIGYVSDLQLMAVSLCALTAWLFRFRLISLLPIIGFALMRAGTGGRSPFVIAAVSAGLFYLFDKRLRMPSLRVVLGAILLVVSFNAIGSDRGAALRQLAGVEQTDEFEKSRDEEEFFLNGMDFANMEFFEFLVYVVPQRSGTYNYFTDNLQVLTEPIPRKWWPEKPIGEPIHLMDMYLYGHPIGMTRSLPGEGWYALGWVGVVIWCALWGSLLGRAYNKFVTGPQTTWRVAMYLVFLPTLIVVFRDGTLLQLVRSTGVYFTPIAVWALLARQLHLPSAAQLQAKMVALRRSPGPAAANPGFADTADHTFSRLPPAVQRRRLALKQPPVSSAE